MRHLSLQKTRAMGFHRASGQAVARFVDHGEGDDCGLVRDVYLGVHGSEGATKRHEEAIREWVSRSLRVGWAPAGWRPAQTGHEGVLTVEELIEGYRRHLDRDWGKNWQQVEIDPDQVQEYRRALESAWELMRDGRPRKQDGVVCWNGDRQKVRDSKQLAQEARRRYGHLDASLKRLWPARVLEDLLAEFGPMAAAVVGDREMRLLKRKWAEEGRSLTDRKAGMSTVQDAYCYVVGRKPWAPWNRKRTYFDGKVVRYGLDLGIVGADGRWVRSG